MTAETLNITVPSEQVLQTLAATRRFNKSSRHYALLDYLFKASNAGRDISEYDIAYDVFNRGEMFDPKIDSIVRTEMHRLRKSLEMFNLKHGQSAGFTVDLPPQSYIPVIIPDPNSNKHSPRKRPAWLRFVWIPLIFAALIGLILFFKPHTDSTNPAIIADNAPRIVPSLYVDYEKGDIHDPDNNLKKIKDRLELYFSSFFAVNLVTQPDHAEYRLTLKDLRMNRPDDPDNNSFILQLSGADAEIISSKQVDLSKTDNLSNIDELIDWIVMDMAYVKGTISRNFYRNPRIPEKQREQFKCLMDIIGMNAWDIMTYFDTPADLVTCSDVSRVEHPKDKSIMHAARGLLFYSDKMGYFDVNVSQDTFQLAEDEITAASHYDMDHTLYFLVLLSIERIRPGARDETRIRKILRDAEIDFSHDQYFMRAAAQVYGLILGDWDAVERIMLPMVNFGSDENSPYYRNLIAAALAKGDLIKAVDYSHKYLGDINTTPNLVLDKFNTSLITAVACQAQNADLLTALTPIMAEHQLNDIDVYTNYIHGLRYAENITTAMLSPAEEPVCAVFAM